MTLMGDAILQEFLQTLRPEMKGAFIRLLSKIDDSDGKNHFQSEEEFHGDD
jgi:hypothetical protein